MLYNLPKHRSKRQKARGHSRLKHAGTRPRKRSRTVLATSRIQVECTNPVDTPKTLTMEIFLQLLATVKDATHVFGVWYLLPDSGKFLLTAAFAFTRFCCLLFFKGNNDFDSRRAVSSNLPALLLDALFLLIARDRVHYLDSLTYGTLHLKYPAQSSLSRLVSCFTLVFRVLFASWVVFTTVPILLALSTVLHDPAIFCRGESTHENETAIPILCPRRGVSNAVVKDAVNSGVVSPVGDEDLSDAYKDTLTWLSDRMPIIFRALTCIINTLEGPSVEAIRTAATAVDTYMNEHSLAAELRLSANDRVTKLKCDIAVYGQERVERQLRSRGERRRLCHDMRELRRRTRSYIEQLSQMSNILCNRRDAQIVRICELSASKGWPAPDEMLKEITNVEDLQKAVDRFGFELEKLLTTKLEWDDINSRQRTIEAFIEGVTIEGNVALEIPPGK